MLSGTSWCKALGISSLGLRLQALLRHSSAWDLPLWSPRLSPGTEALCLLTACGCPTKEHARLWAVSVTLETGSLSWKLEQEKGVSRPCPASERATAEPWALESPTTQPRVGGAPTKPSSQACILSWILDTQRHTWEGLWGLKVCPGGLGAAGELSGLAVTAEWPEGQGVPRTA